MSVEDRRMEETGHIKLGQYIIIEGVPSKVVDILRSAPGKHGHAKCRISAVGVFDDKKRVVLKPAHSQLEVPLIDKKNGQIIAVATKTKQTPDGTIEIKVANVMDSDTFETFEIEVPTELVDKAVEGKGIVYWEILGKRIMRELKE